MPNSSNNTKANTNTFFTVSLVILFALFAMYVYHYVMFNDFEKIKLELYTFKTIPSLSKDSVINLKNDISLLKSSIEKIELVNDKRFEVLGWSFSVLCTFIAIVLTVNISNSKTSIKDGIRDEIEKIDVDRIEKNKQIITDLEKIKSEYLSEIQKLKASNKTD